MDLLTATYPEVMPLEAWSSGLSPFRCDNCGTHIAKEAEHVSPIWYASPLVKCSICGDVFEGSITVTLPSAHLLYQEEAISTVWYHATDVEDWFGKISTGHGMEDEAGDFLYVHVGIEQASREIANIKYFTHANKEAVSLYQVKLKADTLLSSRVVHDTGEWNGWNSVTEKTRTEMGGDATRYLNRWESPGSISLLVDARQLELVQVAELANPYLDELVCA